MNAKEIVEAALARCAEFNLTVPATMFTCWQRSTRRMEQLYARGAVLNREFFGADEAANLIANQINTDLFDPIPMRIHVVRIEGAGPSPYVFGQKVAVVQADDVEAELPPRCLLRDGKLIGVGTDLDLVESLRVWHSKRPAPILAEADIPELPEQFHELLVVDLAKWLIRKTLGIAKESRKEMLDILGDEEKELVRDFERFLTEWSFAETSRFGSTPRQG